MVRSIVLTTRPGRARRASTPETEGDHGERNQECGVEARPGCLAEQDRDSEDRPELPRHARREGVWPERRFELAGVPQDRHQRADRGRRERDSDQEGRKDEPGCLQDARDRECKRKGEQPAPHGEPRRLPADLKEVDLHPGEEEEEREPGRR